MSQSEKKPDEGGFAAVIFTENYREAEYYKALLEDHGIDVRIGDEAEVTTDGKEEEEAFEAQGVPVMVPADSLSEAEDIIDRHHEAEDDFDDDEYDDDSEDDDYGDLEEFDPDDEDD